MEKTHGFKNHGDEMSQWFYEICLWILFIHKYINEWKTWPGFQKRTWTSKQDMDLWDEIIWGNILIFKL